MKVNKTQKKYDKTCTTVWLLVSKLQTESEPHQGCQGRGVWQGMWQLFLSFQIPLDDQAFHANHLRLISSPPRTGCVNEIKESGIICNEITEAITKSCCCNQLQLLKDG